jgi:hypothetical protein
MRFLNGKKAWKEKVPEKDGESGPENIWMHTDVQNATGLLPARFLDNFLRQRPIGV